MFKNLFLPTESNRYTPRLLSRGIITFYTLVLLIFNIATADIAALSAQAAVDSQSILQLHNQERVKNGLGELKLNSSLNKSAKLKAQAMLASDCWDHYCPEGKSPWDFFIQAGYDYVYAGENLAEGFTSNSKVFSAWMNSQTHRENILRPEFDEVGIAIEYGYFQGIENNAVIVVHFGRRSNYTPPVANTPPAPTVEKTEYGKISITSPKQDELINDNTPEIKGDATSGTIEISESGKKLGETISEEGLFTYKIPTEKALVEGEHTIDASFPDLEVSDSVKFTVDTIPPQVSGFTLNSITQGEDSVAITELSVSSDTLSIEANDSSIKLTPKTDKIWVVEIPTDYINSHESISITAYDKASNKLEQNIDLGQIKGELVNENELLENNGIDISIFSQIGIRRIINILFIGMLTILFVIDYIALAKTDLPFEIIKTKAHYHMSIFILLLLISIAGGTAGELLDGQQI